VSITMYASTTGIGEIQHHERKEGRRTIGEVCGDYFAAAAWLNAEGNRLGQRLAREVYAQSTQREG
jgi:hypothetical protein